MTQDSNSRDNRSLILVPNKIETVITSRMRRGIGSINIDTLWELDRFVKNYTKSSKRKVEVPHNVAITVSWDKDRLRNCKAVIALNILNAFF